jgi:hypothetical protein
MSDSASSDEESRTLSQLCSRHQKRAMKVIHEFVLVRGGGGAGGATPSTPSLEQDETKSQETTETNHHHHVDGIASSGEESSSGGIGGVNSNVFQTLKSEEERYEMDQGKSRTACASWPHTIVAVLNNTSLFIFPLVLVVQTFHDSPTRVIFLHLVFIKRRKLVETAAKWWGFRFGLYTRN